MIRIKGRTNTPSTLQSPKVTTAKQKLEEKVSRGEGIHTKDFHSEYWGAQDVKGSLFDSQHGKCCFCENIRSPKRELDVEHFRPKAGIDGEPNHTGYWWLAYEWSNLVYACKPCNETYKKNQFPISGVRALNPEDKLEDENPKLIHPVDEDPAEFIIFDWWTAYGKMVKAVGRDDDGRGNKTINVVALNRFELMEERATSLRDIETTAFAIKHANDRDRLDIVAEFADKIRYMTSSKHRFSGFHRVFFRSQGLEKYVADD